MSDGVHLSARIWLPSHVGNNSVAAILEYIPYRKRDMVRVRDERNHVYFAQQGYVSVRVDMRGSGDSGGHMEDMYGIRELSDAKEVIEWIAAQHWCNGQVGMMGTSWGGTSSLQTAIEKPAALKAIIAVCATDNRFEDDIHYMGGCVLTDTVEWAATLPVILRLFRWALIPMTCTAAIQPDIVNHPAIRWFSLRSEPIQLAMSAGLV